MTIDREELLVLVSRTSDDLKWLRRGARRHGVRGQHLAPQPEVDDVLIIRRGMIGRQRRPHDRRRREHMALEIELAFGRGGACEGVVHLILMRVLVVSEAHPLLRRRPARADACARAHPPRLHPGSGEDLANKRDLTSATRGGAAAGEGHPIREPQRAALRRSLHARRPARVFEAREVRRLATACEVRGASARPQRLGHCTDRRNSVWRKRRSCGPLRDAIADVKYHVVLVLIVEREAPFQDWWCRLAAATPAEEAEEAEAAAA